MPSQWLIHLRHLFINSSLFQVRKWISLITLSYWGKRQQSKPTKILWNKSVYTELKLGGAKIWGGVHPPCLSASDMPVWDLTCKPPSGYTRWCICLCIRTLIILHFFFSFLHWTVAVSADDIARPRNGYHSLFLVWWCHSIYIYRAVTF